ncbi:MAG: alkaline phosphatase family protein [Firmicutes bacterium]|nr:alkaline phosphatase family protein [Bacillota bacterium]
MNKLAATLADLLPNVWPLFSAEAPSPRVHLPTRARPGEIDHLVLWVIDGLGYDQVVRALQDGLMPHLARVLRSPLNQWHPIKSVSPSVTPVALASLLTGTVPAVHGLLGQVMYWNNAVVDVLHGPLPEGFALAAAPAGVTARRLGVSYRVVLEHRLRSGPLTQVLHREVEGIDTYIRDSGLPVIVNGLLRRMPRGVIYVYSSGIDSINHQRGAYGEEWRAEIAALDRALAAMTALRERGTVLWITADHGHVPVKGVIPYDQVRELVPWLPSRAARLGPAISVDVKDAVEFAQVLKTVTPATVEIVDVSQVVAEGYFGAPALGVFQSRLGTHLVRPEPGWTWAENAEESALWGHGGASQAEMEVPWIEVFLSAG